MNDFAPEIRAAAYSALRNAGLLHADPDLAGLFDLSEVRVSNGRAIVPPSFVKTARAAKPDLFTKDAMSMTAAEVTASINKIATTNANARLARESQAFLDGLKKKYAA
ncbi:MAG: hypothetical protein WDN02_05195 [Methylovirgula sp.]|uniref:hypothetical protein n=1 Tax=Methylovirgula sp. TaxID=1978224 RepID=UPI00307608BA